MFLNNICQSRVGLYGILFLKDIQFAIIYRVVAKYKKETS